MSWKERGYETQATERIHGFDCCHWFCFFFFDKTCETSINDKMTKYESRKGKPQKFDGYLLFWDMFINLKNILVFFFLKNTQKTVLNLFKQSINK